MALLDDCPAFVTEAIEQAADRVALTHALLTNNADALLFEVRAAIEKHEDELTRGEFTSKTLQRLRDVYGPALKVAA